MGNVCCPASRKRVTFDKARVCASVRHRFIAELFFNPGQLPLDVSYIPKYDQLLPQHLATSLHDIVHMQGTRLDLFKKVITETDVQDLLDNPKTDVVLLLLDVVDIVNNLMNDTVKPPLYKK